MIQVETSVTIEHSPEAVFAFASDPLTGPSWQWAVPHGPRPAPGSAEVVFCHPNRAMGVRQCFGDVTCDAVYQFEPAEGGTCVVWTGRVTAAGRYSAVEALIGQAMAMEAEVGLGILKHLLETEQGG